MKGDNVKTKLAPVLLIAAMFFFAWSAGAADIKKSGHQATQKPAAEEPPPAPIFILSIIPAQGEPGKTVTLSGSGFTPDTTVYLANNETTPEVSGSKLLTFEVPDLQPGLYALYLRRGDGTVSKPYNFTVTPPKPSISDLSPGSVVACSSGRDRDVTVYGKNFRPGSKLLFDGAAIKSSFDSSESITFATPQVPGGLHQVQVQNPDDTLSGVQALMIDARPEITSVTQGEERVSSYDLLIDGINFQQRSTLVVDGKPIINSGLERESVSYVDCTHMVYERHPYDNSPKTIRLQVITPGGGESSVIQVTAP